jgi:hypothetical protein
MKLIFITITSIVFLLFVGYFDYNYYNSLYHSLLLLNIFIILTGVFIINNTLKELVRIFKKWLGI